MPADFDTACTLAESDRIRGLDISMFDTEDAVNVILQRSEVLADRPRPGRIIRAWSDGDTRPIRAIAEAEGETLIRRAIAFIFLEFDTLRPTLAEIAPARVADIGCGYAIFGLPLALDVGCHLTLIDLEQSDARHFGFQQRAAAYSNLARAAAFLTANGVPDAQIDTLNPDTRDVMTIPPVDLAVSFLSCGFHYPWQTYAAFLGQRITPGGAAILDIRARKAETARRELAAIGTVTPLHKAAGGGAERLLIRTPGLRQPP
ncbi:class I SAM-dependent methyltransferase [uncultured Roseobacter sp.]|uniref:class I SAM-dependent methyltransferase n=1 Tax=uncultured Roseobacter sp. TaxID=114847 RepID=UPI00260E778D|nr:class I SAM-dependent methyltransferase [uncultured Roseobacter sp.]